MAAIGTDFFIPVTRRQYVTVEMKEVALKISTLLVNRQFPSRLYDNRYEIEYRTARMEEAFSLYAIYQVKGAYEEVRANIMTLFTANLANTSLIEKYANLLGYTLDYISCPFDQILTIPYPPKPAMPEDNKHYIQKILDDLGSKAICPPIIRTKPNGFEITWTIPEWSIRSIKEL